MRRVVLAVALVVALASPVRAQEVVVSAAISMKGVVDELGRSFGQRRPGVTLRLNLGSTGELQQQIEAGAPVDLFISAAERQMNELEAKGLVRAGTRRVFARNVLTVIQPVDALVSVHEPADLLDARVHRVVIGNPKTVPAGQYAEESLAALRLWDQIQGKLVFAENVRQALDYVARGEVDAGFVYTTDAAIRRGQVKEAFRPPARSYRPILYLAAVLRDAKQPTIAREFLDLLSSPAGQAVLARHGFQPP